MRGLRGDAEGSHGAQTVSEAQALPPQFCMVRSAGRIHARGRFHIGGVAYCVWAFPPTVGGTARHGQVQRHTTAALTTSKHLLWQCSAAGILVLALPAPA